ncbi:hypothetical protein H5T51_00595 [Candidatus Bathyarchaeota archaeon]|nr:hypothetical protein [Candidatus Bathyarchaeota archaeon]
MVKPKGNARAELYKDSKTQCLLSLFLSGELTELKPVFDPRVGYRYPAVEAILANEAGVESFLNKLNEAGILEIQLYDRIIFCPKCGSQSVSTHYCCPYCESFNIKKSSLIEHVKCGYMGVEENFKKGGKLFCPKCKSEITLSKDYRKAGIWCTCNECGKSFDMPLTKHFCRDCQEIFTFEEIEFKDIYVYRLNEKVKNEIAPNLTFIGPVREFLLENGFDVEAPAFLKGKSGATHIFDIAVYRGNEKKCLAVMDIATSHEEVITEQPVIALFAKIYDVSPESAYLIAIPELNENAKKMAELYNIKIIEGKSANDVISAIKEYFPPKN